MNAPPMNRAPVTPGSPLGGLLRTYLAKYRRPLTIVLVLQVIQTIAGLYLPSLNARIIDRGIARGDSSFIRSAGLVMLLITLVQVSFSIAAVYFGSKAAMGFGRDVRSSLFHQVTSFSAREMGTFGAPSLITRITNDVQQVQMLVLLGCTMLVAAPITIIGGVIMALRQDLGLSSILIVSIPVLLFSIGTVVSKMIPQFRVMQVKIDSINRVLREQITGIRVVRAFVREPFEAKRFAAVNEDLTGTALRAGHLQAFMYPTVMFVLNVSSVAALWVGGSRIGANRLSLGAMVAFLSYLAQILLSIMLATVIAVMIPRAAVCAERIQEVLNTPSSVVLAANPVVSVSQSGSLELRNVGFNYPGAEHPVLESISLTSLAGQTTAIIGSTGAGKTTLINLIPRLADATSGAVLVDGVDVRELDAEALWRRVGLVPQKPFLFTGTVASNLRYGKPEATDEELWEALGVAQAEDFVKAMPDGLNARIAQGGANVSGGQRQRLAIARALVRKPEIYLFDDSFSALDLATDARLRKALVAFTQGATVIIVAQRVSTISSADQILVLEGGVAVGLGSHDYLLEHCPTYAEIVASQLGQGAHAA